MSAIRIGRVWLIAGPTASGKSALALRLARALDGEIVNADSMQVYRDLSLLTARPSHEDEAQAPHHLFGVADGAEPWSVGTWLRAVGPILAGIAARGRPAVVVGGTGLYFRALTRGLADIPAVPPAVRAEVAALFAEAGEAAFRQALARLDPQSAARIAPGDRQRLTRALEVAQASGRPIGDWQAQTRPVLAQDHRAVVIDPPRPQLYARCDARLTAMVQAGAADEVAALTARGLEPEAPVMKALGVQALARHLQGALSLSEALATAQQETRRYAKRQSTWFRGQAADWPRIEAMEPQAQWDHLVALGAPASASA